MLLLDSEAALIFMPVLMRPSGLPCHTLLSQPGVALTQRPCPACAQGHLACSDYEGVVALWDANANTELMQASAGRLWGLTLHASFSLACLNP
jgi:hypothetical protein